MSVSLLTKKSKIPRRGVRESDQCHKHHSPRSLRTEEDDGRRQSKDGKGYKIQALVEEGDRCEGSSEDDAREP